MPITNKDGHWLDARGNYIPAEYVTAIDKKRDRLVTSLLKKAKKLNQQLIDFKIETDQRIDAFLEESLKDTGWKPRGDKSVTLNDFAHHMKVERTCQEYIDFDEKLKAVKSLIDECIQEWGQNTPVDLQVIVNEVFSVNRKGRLNIKGLLSLRRLNIKHPKWKKAMSLLDEAKQIVATKIYTRFFEKDKNSDGFKAIVLDIAAVQANGDNDVE